MDDVIKEFLIESYENLDRLERDLVGLEQKPDDREILARIFRTFHTIKGTSGFLGFGKLESLTHVGENLLSKMRDGDLHLSPSITSSLLTLGDAVRAMLSNIENCGDEGGDDHVALKATLALLLSGEEPALAAAPVAVKPVATPIPVVHPPLAVVPEPAAVAPATPANAATSGAPISDSSIRVDVGLLDKLMNLVGELVLARNQVLQFAPTQKDAAFQATSQRLNLITSELQEGVMKTRMQPIGNIWSKLPRVVRDLSLLCGKQVRVEMEGTDTELDKTIIEAIKDPLTHVVRNAVDHGIESPQARVLQGKPAEGQLHLRAYHEGGQVNIEISDDGAGIDCERVKRKALERGLITVEQAARMSERELTMLVFSPGFSTAAAVTNVSGRGVGMDVVKTNIEGIGGTVDVSTTLGKGTTLRLKIPLTLAIIPALTITAAGERYAIPQVSLLELVRLGTDGGKGGVELIHGAPVYRLRGRLLPLVYLARELAGALPAFKPGESTPTQQSTHVVVLQAEGRQFGLVVDDVNDTEEIVVKPLGKKLKSIPVFAGATIMGDGRLALILDVRGLAQRAHLVADHHERKEGTRTSAMHEHEEPRQALLLLRVGDHGRMAIPLHQVARLEEFARSRVERAGGHEMVQYRGDLLPLVHLADFLGIPCGERPEILPVVVFSDGKQSVGLVVERIVDIVEETVTIQHRRGTNGSGAFSGMLGAAVIQQRITELVDVPGVVAAALPSFFSEAA